MLHVYLICFNELMLLLGAINLLASCVLFLCKLSSQSFAVYVLPFPSFIKSMPGGNEDKPMKDNCYTMISSVT